MHRAVLLALALAACDTTRETSAPVPAAQPLAPAPTPAASTAIVSLNLPATEPNPAPPHIPGEPYAPTTHRLPDGREFIHDSNRDRISVRDPSSPDPIDLGQATLLTVPRLGELIVPRPEAEVRYHDVDPDAPRLRLLWTAPASGALFAGVDRGAPVFLVRGATTTAELVRITGPGTTDTRAIDLPLGLGPPSTDAVRDHRLLLVRHEPQRPQNFLGRNFSAAVFVLDVEANTLRPLGDATGAWTSGTAMPHPYVVVRWTDHDPHARDVGWAEDCVNLVDPARERLTPCAPGVRALAD
jgi:hypothetical protein